MVTNGLKMVTSFENVVTDSLKLVTCYGNVVTEGSKCKKGRLSPYPFLLFVFDKPPHYFPSKREDKVLLAHLVGNSLVSYT